MIFRNGEYADSAELTEMRVEYLKADWGTLTKEQEAAIREQLPSCFERLLGENLAAYVAEENGQLAGTVLMLITDKPAGPAFLNGKVGTLMNVYVRPQFRKLGLGAKLVNMALEDARHKGLCHVELDATKQGEKLYDCLGFQKVVSHYTPMVFEL